MNREEIIRMAEEAGGGTPEWDGIWELSEDALERFAALVAAHCGVSILHNGPSEGALGN